MIIVCTEMSIKDTNVCNNLQGAEVFTDALLAAWSRIDYLI
jgi:hypothetical protein